MPGFVEVTTVKMVCDSQVRHSDIRLSTLEVMHCPRGLERWPDLSVSASGRRTLISATTWDAFDQANKPKDLENLCREIASARYLSDPVLMGYMQWHLPYITAEDYLELDPDNYRQLAKVSTARCSRGILCPRNIKNDLVLYERLIVARTFGPFEHQAYVCHSLKVRNFSGWWQYRATIEGTK